MNAREQHECRMRFNYELRHVKNLVLREKLIKRKLEQLYESENKGDSKPDPRGGA